MSVPVHKRHESPIQFIAVAKSIERHLSFYLLPEKFINGNPTNKFNIGERIYKIDLERLKQLGNELYEVVVYTNNLRTDIRFECEERIKMIIKALSILKCLDEELQKLINKYVKFDNETDEIISCLPNEYFYEHLANLMTDERNLLNGLKSSNMSLYIELYQ